MGSLTPVWLRALQGLREVCTSQGKIESSLGLYPTLLCR